MDRVQSHLTETCDEDLPHLITHVRTCPGTEDDSAAFTMRLLTTWLIVDSTKPVLIRSPL